MTGHLLNIGTHTCMVSGGVWGSFIGIRMGDYRGEIMVVEGMNNKGVEEIFRRGCEDEGEI